MPAGSSGNFLRGDSKPRSSVWAMPSFTLWSKLSEEELWMKFCELDVDHSGTLTRQEACQGLCRLGRSEAEVQKELSRWPSDVDFQTFKQLAKGKDARAAFDKVDVDGYGQLLGREEIADALREMGKSQKQIDSLVRAMPDGQEMDFEGFQE
ncbi:unnamed protein product, partial [Effrenium voratum]